MNARSLVLAAACALSLSVGCTVAKPTMHLRSAYVSGILFPGSLQLTCEMDVTNPNSYDVAIRALRGEVTLAGNYRVPVNFQPPGNGVWLPAGRTTTVTVPVQIPLVTAAQLTREALTSAVIPFEFQGRADVTATSTFKIERDDYVVSERGTIPRQQLTGGW